MASESDLSPIPLPLPAMSAQIPAPLNKQVVVQPPAPFGSRPGVDDCGRHRLPADASRGGPADVRGGAPTNRLAVDRARQR